MTFCAFVHFITFDYKNNSINFNLWCKKFTYLLAKVLQTTLELVWLQNLLILNNACTVYLFIRLINHPSEICICTASQAICVACWLLQNCVNVFPSYKNMIYWRWCLPTYLFPHWNLFSWFLAFVTWIDILGLLYKAWFYVMYFMINR